MAAKRAGPWLLAALAACQPAVGWHGMGPEATVDPSGLGPLRARMNSTNIINITIYSNYTTSIINPSNTNINSGSTINSTISG